ncbi:MAG: radical SAM family heme chaperone HemW [Saprospiraceae bacterium]|nr:radical SAM family heme chaperone HemW [Saprospiraceae bacterium]
MKDIGIYIHIPYCKRKCSYCNFHFSTNFSTKDDLISSILLEIQARKHESQDMRVSSIYFGGGTPSVLNSIELNRIFDMLLQHYQLGEGIEISFEMNPDDVVSSYVKELVRTPINRISLGVQSFHDSELRFMNRVHDANVSNESIRLLQDFGYGNLTIDLIYGVPQSSTETWAANLNKLLEYSLNHFSAYLLTVEDRTKLSFDVKNSSVKMVTDEIAIEQMNYLLDFAEASGFEAYEISNFAKEGYRAIHNSNYWKGIPYLGFGPSAHSYDGVNRRANISHNLDYIKAVSTGLDYFDIEILSNKNRCNEFLMLNLRKIEGIDLALLEENFTAYFPRIYKIFQQYEVSGDVIEKNNFISLTKKGRMISDKIISDLFEV